MLTIGGSLVAIFYPFIGILVFVWFAIAKPEDLWSWSVSPGNYSRIVMLATLVGWVCRGLGSWSLGKSRGIVLAIIGLFLWSILGALRAPNQDVAWAFVDQLSKIVVPVVVGISLVQSVDQLKQLAWVIALSYGYLALEFNRMYYAGNFMPGGFSFGGMEEGSVAIGMICASGLSFFFGLYQKTLWKQLLLFGVAGLTGHFVLFSFSRGGVLGLLTSLLIALLVVKKNFKTLLVIALALLLGLRLAGPEVRERFTTIFISVEERDASARSRLDLWKACVKTMVRNPVFGIGPDHWTVTGNRRFKGQITLYADRKEAHTLWLQLGAELGAPGLLLILSFYTICIIRVWPLARGARTVAGPRPGLPVDTDEWTRYGACMVVVPLCGFMVAAQFISLEFLEVPYYITLLGAGLLKLEAAPEEKPVAYSKLPGGVSTLSDVRSIV
jgi:probable O-glycosylation ligase (exosortase A-associated)